MECGDCRPGVTAPVRACEDTELPRIPGKSKLAEAIRYATRHRAGLERFLADGRLDIDNNPVERAIRPQTITRKNALFAGSEGPASYCRVSGV